MTHFAKVDKEGKIIKHYKKKYYCKKCAKKHYWNKHNPTQTVIIRSGRVVPDRLFTKLTYTLKGLSILASSASGIQVMAGNGLFDPDTTGVGQQPVGFDELSALYTRNRVYGSSIKVMLLKTSDSCEIALTPSTSSTSPAAFREATENSYCKFVTISSSVFKAVISNFMDTKKIWGVTKITSEDTFEGTTTGNPSKIWYWVINASSYDGTTAITTHIDIKVTYLAEFFQRKILTQS